MVELDVVIRNTGLTILEFVGDHVSGGAGRKDIGWPTRELILLPTLRTLHKQRLWA